MEDGKKRGRTAGLDRPVNSLVYFSIERCFFFFLPLLTIYSYSYNVNTKDATGAKSSIHVTAYS